MSNLGKNTWDSIESGCEQAGSGSLHSLPASQIFLQINKKINAGDFEDEKINILLSTYAGCAIMNLLTPNRRYPLRTTALTCLLHVQPTQTYSLGQRRKLN